MADTPSGLNFLHALQFVLEILVKEFGEDSVKIHFRNLTVLLA